MATHTNWEQRFVELGALWIHDENPQHPHALLTSGMHSSGFFNATSVIEHPHILEQACQELMKRTSNYLQLKGEPSPKVVIGSAYGAITIAHECAKSIGARMAFTEKEQGGMTLSHFSLQKNEYVIPVEDVLTTGRTTLKTISAIYRHDAIVLPVIAVFVNRSGKNTLDGRKIISLVENPMPKWEKGECPHCKEGSEALRPKTHWRELTNPS